MADLLYDWPVHARVETRIPKERFYAEGTVAASVKEKFVSQVSRIIWTHKLSVDTLNILGTDILSEIDVFRVDTKDGDLVDDVLTAIDKAIPRPLIFEVTRPRSALGSGHGLTRMTAAHKQSGAGVPKLSKYFTTEWLPTDHERVALPTAISIPVLYAALLQPMTPLQTRPGEELAAVAERLETIGRLDREIATLERKLRTEPQLNRKVELRRELKTKQHVREQQR